MVPHKRMLQILLMGTSAVCSFNASAMRSAFRKSVAQHIANTVTCENYGIAICVFGNVDNGETAVCFVIDLSV